MQHSASSYAQQCTARCKTVHRRMHKLMKASETNFCLNMHMQSKNNSFDFENKPFGLNIKKHGLHSMLLNAIRVYDISLIEFYFNPPDFVNAYPKIHQQTMERYVDDVSAA